MIRNPWLLAAVLAGVVALLQWARRAAPFRRVFDVLPVPFWCYFLPMVGATAGFFSAESALHPWLARYLLPFCLAMLLMTVNLRALAGLSRRGFETIAVGMLSIMVGAVAAFAVFHRRLPPESWRAVGALSGSWIGGSANMLALKEALATPEEVFAPVVVVDTLLAYGWMAFLIFLAGRQARVDAWNRVTEDRGLADTVAALEAHAASRGAPSAAWTPFAFAGVLAGASLLLGDRLPPVGSVLTRATWAVLVVSTLSLAFSLTPAASSLPAATEKWGTAILYILLASLGSRVKLTVILDAPLFLATGMLWMVLHGTMLFLYGRWRRVPLFLLATASQACVGGPISAPIVAAVYRPPLAAVGLLMAVIGNVAGTYLGFVTAQVLKIVDSGW